MKQSAELQSTDSLNSFFERYFERQLSQKRGLSSDFESLCGSEACSNSDLERSSGSCASFIKFSGVLERGPPSDAKCAKLPRTAVRIFIYIYILTCCSVA